MLSKNKLKLIHSLAKKKYRDEHRLFVAEGNKLVSDLLSTSLKCIFLAATNEWMKEHQPFEADECVETTFDDLKKASQLKSTPPVIALFKQPLSDFDPSCLRNELVIYLDEVQDPGNLGTIVRIASWFGINHVICSPDCADVYNTKTIQSTMGAIAKIQVHYLASDYFFDLVKKASAPIYGTFLDGENIHTTDLSKHGVIVMGNEGKGISQKIEDHVTKRLFIPSYPADAVTIESLNVSVATAITCAEFRRRG